MASSLICGPNHLPGPKANDRMKLSSRFESAFSAAASLHPTQVRKGTDTPYIAHLLAVASLVLEHGGTEDEAIAALLHDAVEDQGGLPTLQRIRDEFGDAEADIVEDPRGKVRYRSSPATMEYRTCNGPAARGGGGPAPSAGPPRSGGGGGIAGLQVLGRVAS